MADSAPSAPSAPTWQELKKSGNEEYAGGRTEAALAAYTAALTHESLPALERATLLCNRAQAALKLGQFAAAADDCTACLAIQPASFKALFRR